MNADPLCLLSIPLFSFVIFIAWIDERHRHWWRYQDKKYVPTKERK